MQGGTDLIKIGFGNIGVFDKKDQRIALDIVGHIHFDVEAT